MPSPPLPASPEAAVALLSERLEGQKELVKEFRGLMVQVQQQLSTVATSQQVEQIHRELVRAQDEQGRELLGLKITLHGPPNQPEAGIVSIVMVLRAQVDVLERRWERVVGYVLGAGAAGGGIGALLHSFFTAVGK